MLGYADYAVLAATLLVSAAIGLYYRFTGGRQGLFHTCMQLNKLELDTNEISTHRNKRKRSVISILHASNISEDGRRVRSGRPFRVGGAGGLLPHGKLHERHHPPRGHQVGFGIQVPNKHDTLS